MAFGPVRIEHHVNRVTFQDHPALFHLGAQDVTGRVALLEVADSPSLFLAGMQGSRIPVAVAHGEGRASFEATGDAARVAVALNYINGDGSPATSYPANPNGSAHAIAGVCSDDGRVTILMPHPERTLRNANFSWAPRDWRDASAADDSPWQRMFRNARVWVG